MTNTATPAALALAMLASACLKPAPPVVPATPVALREAPQVEMPPPSMPAASEPEVQPPLRWAAEGWLDKESGSCTGSASVTVIQPSWEDYTRCWALMHDSAECTAPDIDWVSEGGPELCRDKTDAYHLVGDLPGKGRCRSMQSRSVVTWCCKLALDCEWECRFEEVSCYGAACYQYRH